eukprot:Em0019g612a
MGYDNTLQACQRFSGGLEEATLGCLPHSLARGSGAPEGRLGERCNKEGDVASHGGALQTRHIEELLGYASIVPTTGAEMEMYCNELQTSLIGCRLCSIRNAQRYCIALLRMACMDTSEPAEVPTKTGTPGHQESVLKEQADSKAPRSTMDTVILDNSEVYWMVLTWRRQATKGTRMEGYLVPKDVRKPVKLWTPILYWWNCCESALIKWRRKTGFDGDHAECICTSFESDSERSIACCRLICNISEVLALHQVSTNEVRKLFQRLQVKKVHLEAMSSFSGCSSFIAQSSGDIAQPSAYLQFNFKRSTDRLDVREMLTVPGMMAWGPEPCSVSLWLSVNKYPLQATFHILTVNMGPCYLQLFASALTGDVIVRICSEFRLDTPDAENTLTLGSVLTPHKWHHLLITVFPSGSPQNYKVSAIQGSYPLYLMGPYATCTNRVLLQAARKVFDTGRNSRHQRMPTSNLSQMKKLSCRGRASWKHPLCSERKDLVSIACTGDEAPL